MTRLVMTIDQKLRESQIWEGEPGDFGDDYDRGIQELQLLVLIEIYDELRARRISSESK